jgi:hypothetical protein
MFLIKKINIEDCIQNIDGQKRQDVPNMLGLQWSAR